MTDLDVVTLQHAGRCACGSPVAAGEPVGYDRERHTVVCSDCLTAASGVPTLDELAATLDSSSFGGRFGAHAIAVMNLSAARAEAADASGAADAGVEGYRSRHASVDEPGSRTLHLPGRGDPSDRAASKATKQSNEGQRAIAEALSAVVESGDALVLTERRIPGVRGHVEHLVVSGTGVFVVDAERYAGAPVAVRQAGGMFGPRRTDLYVRGRQRNDLVHGVEKLASAVRTVLDGVGLADIPVTPVLCLVGGSFPMFQSTLPAGETTVVGLKPLRKLLGRAGHLYAEDRERVYVSLAASLPAMT